MAGSSQNGYGALLACMKLISRPYTVNTTVRLPHGRRTRFINQSSAAMRMIVGSRSPVMPMISASWGGKKGLTGSPELDAVVSGASAYTGPPIGRYSPAANDTATNTSASEMSMGSD